MQAQLENKSVLKIGDIMQGEGFIGNLPHSIQWMPNNNVLFKQDKDNNRVDEYYLLNIATNEVSLACTIDLALIAGVWISETFECESFILHQ